MGDGGGGGFCFSSCQEASQGSREEATIVRFSCCWIRGSLISKNTIKPSKRRNV